jgi:hypothetical protein
MLLPTTLDPEPSTTPAWHPCRPDPSCVHCNFPGTAGSPRWSFVDAVYCISLKTREDRVASASAEFHKVGLCRQVLFHRPDRHPNNGIVGCWESTVPWRCTP